MKRASEEALVLTYVAGGAGGVGVGAGVGVGVGTGAGLNPRNFSSESRPGTARTVMSHW